MWDCCVIGSRNKAKIRGAVQALRLIGISTIHSIEVDGLNPQPTGFDEILEGARRRARTAYEYMPKCLGLGIEAGLIEINGVYYSGQVAVVFDGERELVGFSMFFPVPDKVVDLILKKGVEMKKAVEEVTGIRGASEKIGVIGLLSIGMVTRTDLSYQAVLSAVLPLINKDYYQ